MVANIVDMLEARFEKEKFQAMSVVESFIADKITQRYLWYLLLATKHSFKKKMLSSSKVQEIVDFLSGRFLISSSGVEYAKTFTFSNEVVGRKKVALVTLSSDVKPAKKARLGLRLVKDSFHLSVFQKIKTVADSGLLEYRTALSIVKCALENYPETKLCR